MTKTLITTRLYPRELEDLGGVRKYELVGMDSVDAVEFFRKQGIKGSGTEVARACAEYGFHPLSLRLLSGLLSRDPRYQGDIQFASKVNVLSTEKPSRILEMAFDGLPKHERRFLSQLAVFSESPSWYTLAAIFGQDFKDENEFVQTLIDLEDRGFFLRGAKPGTFYLHPMIRLFCYDRLEDKAEIERRISAFRKTAETVKSKEVGSEITLPDTPGFSEEFRVFLCHSSKDKPAVRNLYKRLRTEGIDVWLDEEKLLPGQDWQLEITKAVRASDVVIVCLSSNATSRAGYIHTEIKYALDVADKQPEGTIFVIPLKLEECEVPDRLSRFQWVNLFEEKGYERLIRALRVLNRRKVSR